MIEREEVGATEIDLSSLHELGSSHPFLRQLVIDFEIAKLEERAVKEPKSIGVVVVGIAFRAECGEFGCRCCLRCPPVVVVILRDGGVTGERLIHTCRGQQAAVASGTLEESFQSQSLVFCTEVEIEVDLRACVAVSDGSLVVAVDDTIVVDILVLDVAGAWRAAKMLRCGGIDVGLILEEANSLVAVDLMKGMSRTAQIVVERRCLVLLYDFIAYVVEVTTSGELPVTDLLGIFQSEFPTPAVDDAVAFVGGHGRVWRRYRR